MNYFDFKINHDISHKLLKEAYDSISKNINSENGKIIKNDYIFNNYNGDITKNIKWTWAVNEKSLLLFSNVVNNYMKTINDYFNNNFFIIGGSFITLYDKEVTESEFHLDINSHYDNKYSTNVLTLLFPLYINNNMGNLQYYDSNNSVNLYKYDLNKAIVWDACKFNHRTQPYKLNKIESRVLVSVNFASKEQWAQKITYNTLKYQGNII